MLVLSRKVSETILIGKDIRVMVVEIKANAVRLGITAPSELPVHRREVAEAIRLQELRQTILNGPDSEKEAAAAGLMDLGRKNEAEELLDQCDQRKNAR